MNKQVQIANYLLENEILVSYVDFGKRIHCVGCVKSFHVNKDKGEIEILLKVSVTENFDNNRHVQLIIPLDKAQMPYNLIQKMGESFE